MKVNYSPEQVAAQFRNCGRRWWIAGGWAIDYYLGKVTREHEDVDVAILKSDEKAFRSYMQDWEIWPGLGDNKLEDKPIRIDEALSEERGVLWCRPSPADEWAFELLLNPTKGSEWVFKRDERIRKPLDRLGSVTDDGIPYLNPEIVLLFKAKNNREKDQQDFETVIPMLGEDARRWLRHSIQIVHPDHPWLTALCSTPTA